MDWRQGCLTAFARLLGIQRNGRQKDQDTTGSRWPTPPQQLPAPPSVELFATPGHGRTSYIWSLLFMLRQLSRVWPGYLCWPDEATGRSLQDIHEKLRLGLLPDRSIAETDSPRRYALHLRNLNPWGERHFVVWDSSDTVFGPRSQGSTHNSRPIDWNVPVLWLLSLSDLDEVSGRFLDLALDDLIRTRLASGEAARERQLRLIVVFTKGDAITDLPAELRTLLKADPLAKALAETNGGTFRAHDEIVLPRPPATRPEQFPLNDPLRNYFESRREVDVLIRAWMNANSAGRALLGRAIELDVDLRFSVVSATGSGFASEARLATAWSPRRVLDPYFWSLELGA